MTFSLHPALRCAFATALVLVMWGNGPADAAAQLMPARPSRALLTGTSVTTPASYSQSMDVRTGILVATSLHTVQFETDQSNMTLGVEIDGFSEGWSDLQLEIVQVNFTSINPLGPGATTGTPAATQVFTTTGGPRTLLAGISNIRATANIRVTVRLASRYALANDRQFFFRYSIY